MSSEGTNRFVRSLDQLLPFLTAAPHWLKSWIYILILLNFITAAGLAIFYLMGKETATEKQSMHSFAVLRPAQGEEIPLDASQSWMVVGTFPETTDPNLSKNADVNVEVYKLPERTAIPQPPGHKRISTAEGTWRYESAKFDGYGPYEIVATAYLNGENVFRSIQVTCSDKASVFRQSIEREKQFRTGANIETMSGGADLVPQVLQQFYAVQNQYFAVIPFNPTITDADLQKGLIYLNEGLDLLDSVLPTAPNNWELQNNRAYFLMHYADLTKKLNRPEESKASLSEAQLMFETIRQQQPMDPSAWNGLGDVYLVADQPQKALFYINRALEISSDYAAAQNDKRVAENMLAQEHAQSGQVARAQ
jgi:hypothetical protein